MPNMIQPKIMHNHSIPILIQQLIRHMSRHIVINLSKILLKQSISNPLRFLYTQGKELTETKKLDVPSARSKKSGNSFNHVSSPYMTSFPPSFAFICASQVSWVARVDVVSDSAKLRITSRKEGIEPVVMAFTRGMVIVGEVACAVNGRAEPSRIRLSKFSIL
jgi:hypothetical protein